MWRGLHLAKERVHLVRAHLPARPDRPVARDPAQNGIDPRAENAAVAAIGQLVEDVFQECVAIHLPEDRRRLPHGDGARPERFQNEAQSRQLLHHFQNTPRLRPEVHDLRHQKRLAPHAIVRHLPLQPLIDQPLMRRVLIDDDKSIPRLRDDVILVKLRPRRAEGQVF